MEFIHDKELIIENNPLINAGMADNVVRKICFQGNFSCNEQSIIKSIADYLEKNYRMYQYIKDNGIKFGTEDLFFWTNREYEDLLYFDVVVKAESVGKHNHLVNSIVKYIEESYSNTKISVRLQYSSKLNWSRINEYLSNVYYISDIPFDILQTLYDRLYYSDNELNAESVTKIRLLSEIYLEQFVNKRVVFNGIQGTVRKVEENRYGFFKLRARKSYYNLELNNIQSLSIV